MKRIKILTIVGARPQFVKAAVVSARLSRTPEISEVILHTGQHYDPLLSDIFFRELKLKKAKYNLHVGSGSHAKQTGEMLRGIESVLLKEKPHAVLLYGDTNSTLAGTLAAAKCHIPIAHVEAGLRSFNMRMPEEINRIVTDRLSTFLFCPTKTAVTNLETENITKGVFRVGDVMYDLFQSRKNHLLRRSRQTLLRYNVLDRDYAILTLHRAENTDDHDRLRRLLTNLNTVPFKILFFVHPRTHRLLGRFKNLLKHSPIERHPPVGWVDLLALGLKSRLILTDSGGLQKEACFLKTPCMTLRDETEWVETVALGYNYVVGDNSALFSKALKTILKSPPQFKTPLYGRGDACRRITDILRRHL